MTCQRMAYETLFRPTKDNSWTFYDDVLLDLDLYEDDVKERCVVLGILSEDTCPIFWAHKPSRSLFSFIHKSMHEFMAAVCIAVNFKNKLSLLNNLENVDLQSESMQFVEDVFKKRSTLNDILEVSNVFIFLCGLEPRLATHVWKCIYDICFKDPCVEGYRRTVENDDRCVVDLQDLIFNSVEECNASVVGSQPRFYLGDLIINSRNFDMVCSSIDRQQIALESVLSLTLSIDDCITSRNGDIFRYLPMFQHLEKISIKSGLVALQLCTPSTPDNEQILHVVNSAVAEMMKVNVSTLKSLSVCGAPFTTMFYPVCKTVLYYLPSMINLEAIKMSHMTLNHEHVSSFCEFLQGTSHLEGIYLCLSCECGNQHDVNLSNHHQLKYINYINDVSVDKR
ncbi:uncharacterized protein LOC132735822 isoform X1 [Ruditapes philippinarum]|uniref:uncharacterized protein LOC132735822 isoform X1 n=1 Tax=Ruditapes philippinarum TaxID=129788 RepID=UPI00295A6D79|nr:uncharacterized protein LOC132735822 isoform X1 [Ruditapes philippinarum]XP_060578822.1 uncharacterized protein LOC132735822 isoform X1 [Ruditapes philippinarum]XP_060578830.1 uncharacterized protein LOC132735822 isoform X1 [Ruditapes philippinarum]